METLIAAQITTQIETLITQAQVAGNHSATEHPVNPNTFSTLLEFEQNQSQNPYNHLKTWASDRRNNISGSSASRSSTEGISHRPRFLTPPPECIPVNQVIKTVLTKLLPQMIKAQELESLDLLFMHGNSVLEGHTFAIDYKFDFLGYQSEIDLDPAVVAPSINLPQHPPAAELDNRTTHPRLHLTKRISISNITSRVYNERLRNCTPVLSFSFISGATTPPTFFPFLQPPVNPLPYLHSHYFSQGQSQQKPGLQVNPQSTTASQSRSNKRAKRNDASASFSSLSLSRFAPPLSTTSRVVSPTVLSDPIPPERTVTDPIGTVFSPTSPLSCLLTLQSFINNHNIDKHIADDASRAQVEDGPPSAHSPSLRDQAPSTSAVLRNGNLLQPSSRPTSGAASSFHSYSNRSGSSSGSNPPFPFMSPSSLRSILTPAQLAYSFSGGSGGAAKSLFKGVAQVGFAPFLGVGSDAPWGNNKTNRGGKPNRSNQQHPKSSTSRAKNLGTIKSPKTPFVDHANLVLLYSTGSISQAKRRTALSPQSIRAGNQVTATSRPNPSNPPPSKPPAAQTADQIPARGRTEQRDDALAMPPRPQKQAIKIELVDGPTEWARSHQQHHDESHTLPLDCLNHRTSALKTAAGAKNRNPRSPNHSSDPSQSHSNQSHPGSSSHHPRTLAATSEFESDSDSDDTELSEHNQDSHHLGLGNRRILSARDRPLYPEDYFFNLAPVKPVHPPTIAQQLDPTQSPAPSSVHADSLLETQTAELIYSHVLYTEHCHLDQLNLVHGDQSHHPSNIPPPQPYNPTLIGMALGLASPELINTLERIGF